MLILALESSAKPVSVAVLEVYDDPFQSAKLLGQYFQNNGFSHSRTLMVLTESLLNNLDIKLSDIDLIAVANGPGSFTGVRIGVSAVKGLAWGAQIPVCGVSSLEAMVHQVITQRTGHIEHNIIICPAMDARRNQVYNALFEYRDNTLKRLCDDRAISIEELADELNQYTNPRLIIGDGVDVCKKSGLIENFESVPQLIQYQTAYGVALASVNIDSISAVDLVPVYLRPSQAERSATCSHSSISASNCS